MHDLVGTGESGLQFLSDMFNPTLATLPDYDKTQGDAVTRSWSPHSGLILMELQSSQLAESATRVLDGLDVVGKQLRVRAVTAGEALPKA